jgi:hypothetical protein
VRILLALYSNFGGWRCLTHIGTEGTAGTPVGVTAVEALASGAVVPLNLNIGDTKGSPNHFDSATANRDGATASVRLNRGVSKPWLFTGQPHYGNSSNARADLPLGETLARGIVAAKLEGDSEVDMALPMGKPPAKVVVFLNGGVEGRFLDPISPYESLRDNSLIAVSSRTSSATVSHGGSQAGDTRKA